MNTVYLLLGSNTGNRKDMMRQALELLQKNCGSIVNTSSLYETAAWGIENQADFLNQVLCINTTLSAMELLTCTHNIEDTFGRQRDIKWGPRTLDIDILLYNDEVINQPGLIIPHPFLTKRRFTLTPLCEIAPMLIHPVLNKTMQELLEECPDKLPVKKIEL